MTALRNGLSEEELFEGAEHGEPEKGRWSQTEQLLALLADRVAEVVHVLILANSDPKKGRPDPPEPIRRPGAKPVKPKPKLSDASATWLFQMINGGAA